MARRLALISALSLLLLPCVASGLGIGNIESRSALNEPLQARIPLISATAEDLESLRVGLASVEAFQRVGLDRPFLLSRLQFEVVSADGEPYILVRTEEPVREPFLAFLVEVRWSGGRLLREYTLLLDPPLHMPREEVPPARIAETAPAPGVAPRAAPVRPQAAPVAEAPRPGLREYRVRRNETAWDVAMALRPDDGITVHQMMMALLQANPDAFGGGNVNNLRAGAILRVPERSEIQALSAAEARREFARQVDEWRAGRSPAPAEAPPPEQLLARDEEATGRLRVVAAGDVGGDDATASLLDDDLAVTRETVAALQRELLSSREEVASLRAENAELRQMAAEMRQRVEALERLVDLNLQPGITGAPQAVDPLAGVPLLQEDGPTQTESAVDDPEPTASAEDAAAVDAQEAARAADEPEVAADAEPAPAERPAAPAQPVAEQRVQAAPWEDLRLMGLAAAALLVLLALLLLIRRRRAAAADRADAQTAAEGVQTATPAVTAAGAAGVAGAAGAASAAGAAGAAAGDAPDPLEAAEAYMGYGRYDQAREVIERGLADDPENKQLRLKLLEIHALNNDRPAFEDAAQSLYAQVDGERDPVWLRAMEMGAEIAPENPLFASEQESMREPDGAVGRGADPEPVEQPRSDAALEPSQPFDALLEPDFDTTAGAQQEAAGRPVAEEVDDRQPTLLDGERPEDDFADLEFALDDEDAASEQPRAAAEPARPEGARAEDDELSLDFDGADGAWATELEQRDRVDRPAAGDDEVPALDFDLGDALALGDEEQKPASQPRLDPAAERFAEAAGGRLEQPGPSAADAEAEDDDLFAEADEASTKLDLARAYLDMGDGEGARSLLEEVLEEGSDAQRREARELLEQT